MYSKELKRKINRYFEFSYQVVLSYMITPVIKNSTCFPLVMFQIMLEWFVKNYSITVKDFIEHVASWVETGFVGPEVWLDLKREIRSDVLRPHIQKALNEKKREKVPNDCKLSQVTY